MNRILTRVEVEIYFKLEEIIKIYFIKNDYVFTIRTLGLLNSYRVK